MCTSTTRFSIHATWPPARLAARTCLLAWLVVSLAAYLGLPTAARAEAMLATGQTQGAATRIDLRVIVPARVDVATLSQLDAVQISADDVRRGFLDLDAATLIRISHNTRQGLQLSARISADWVDHVETRLLDQNLTLHHNAGAANVFMPLAEGLVVKVSYRLFLNNRASPGTHAWPVRLAFALGRV